MSRAILTALCVFAVLGSGCPQKFEPVIPDEPATAKQPEILKTEPSMVLVVTSDGSVVYGDRIFKTETELTALRAEVERAITGRSKVGLEQPMVILKSKKDVKYGYVRTVIDELQKVEGLKIGLQIEGQNENTTQ